MKLFALVMVLIAGTMWAGSGIATQLLFGKSAYDAMDLTVFRMIFAGLILLAVNVSRGTLKKNLSIMKKRPKLWLYKENILIKFLTCYIN